jgi:hypothetical protein
VADGGVANRRLRERLAEAGWSPETFARRIVDCARRQRVTVSVHEKTPYHWLRDGRCPHDPVPELGAAVLSERLGRTITPADLGWRPARSLTRRADDGLVGLWLSGGAIHVLEEVASGVQRRGFLVLAGTALTAVAHQWMVLDLQRLTAVLEGGRRVDESLVADFEQLAVLRSRMDDTLGGGALYEAVTADLRVVVRLLETGTYSDGVGRRLYGVAAQFARLAGWSCHETGNEGAAQRFWLTALRAAHEASDDAFGAHVLMFMGMQNFTTGHPNDSVTLLATAVHRGGAALGATQRAAIASELAGANARAGDVYATASQVDTALTLLDDARPDEDPPWIYWSDRPQVTANCGTAHLFLGNPVEAIPHLRFGVDANDAAFARQGAHRMVRLATAQLRAGDADEAIATAHDAIDLTASLNSARVVGVLHEFAREAHRTVGNAASGELVERTRTAAKA